MRFPVAPGALPPDGPARGPAVAASAGSPTSAATLRSRRASRASSRCPAAGRRGISRTSSSCGPSDRRPASRSFRRARRTVLPNPERLYGLFATELRGGVLRRAARAGDARPWHWVARVLDPRAQRGRAAGEHGRRRALCCTRRVHGSTSPPSRRAATPRDAKAWQEGDAGALERRARFSVGVEARRPGREPARHRRRRALPARGADDEERFARTAAGRAGALLDGVLAAARPDARDGGERGASRRSTSACEHARTHTSRAGIGKGMFSRHGPGVHPLRRADRDPPPGDPGRATRRCTRCCRRSSSSPRTARSGDVNQKGPGGDLRPYEVWIYEGDDPAAARRRPRRAGRRDRQAPAVPVRGRARHRRLRPALHDGVTGDR